MTQGELDRLPVYKVMLHPHVNKGRCYLEDIGLPGPPGLKEARTPETPAIEQPASAQINNASAPPFAVVPILPPPADPGDVTAPPSELKLSQSKPWLEFTPRRAKSCPQSCCDAVHALELPGSYPAPPSCAVVPSVCCHRPYYQHATNSSAGRQTSSIQTIKSCVLSESSSSSSSNNDSLCDLDFCSDKVQCQEISSNKNNRSSDILGGKLDPCPICLEDYEPGDYYDARKARDVSRNNSEKSQRHDSSQQRNVGGGNGRHARADCESRSPVSSYTRPHSSGQDSRQSRLEGGRHSPSSARNRNRYLRRVVHYRGSSRLQRRGRRESRVILWYHRSRQWMAHTFNRLATVPNNGNFGLPYT
ncbi:hypothetical protein EV182_002839 [Spiromyces aspiralis]|uniref:Uncharacterized protein n=1 Tax=Spiromyces aspiralis TaxID=68401 RepID=A0ACC1HHG1_9FUNG|nr:hypothetical protein EV182_002839 [Spiromyces aspiralis]